MKSYRHVLLTVAVASAVGGTLLGVQQLLSRTGGQHAIPVPDQPLDHPAVAQSSLQERSHLQSEEDTIVQPMPLGNQTSASEWSGRFHRAADYWEWVNDAAPAAAAGNARAQFLLAEALGECNASVSLNRKLYPDPAMSAEQIFEDSFWKNASPSLPSHYVELSRRNFMKCAKFFEGYPRALEELDIGTAARSRDHWLTLALESREPLAMMQRAYELAADLDSAEEGSRQVAIDGIREGLESAVDSADPESIFRIGVLAAYVGTPDPTEAPAWTLAACELGYDCTYANPQIGGDCVDLGMCTGAESVVLNMQQDLRPQWFGTAFARSQDIVFAITSNNGDRVLEKLLEKLDLE